MFPFAIVTARFRRFTTSANSATLSTARARYNAGDLISGYIPAAVPITSIDSSKVSTRSPVYPVEPRARIKPLDFRFQDQQGLFPILGLDWKW